MKNLFLLTVVAVAACTLGACKLRHKDDCGAKRCCAAQCDSGGSHYGK